MSSTPKEGGIQRRAVKKNIDREVNRNHERVSTDKVSPGGTGKAFVSRRV